MKLKWTKQKDNLIAIREDGLKYKIRKTEKLKGAVAISVLAPASSLWKFCGNMFSLRDAKKYAELDNKIYLQMKKLSVNL